MSIEVIEATESFRTTQILKIDNLIPHLDVFRKIYFLIDSWNFGEILPPFRSEAVEDWDVTFNQNKRSYVKFPLLRIPKTPSNQI